MPKEPTSHKWKKKQIITTGVVVLLFVLAIGAGILVQWLQHKDANGNKGATSDTSSLGADPSGAQAQNSLPDSVKSAQNAAASGNYAQSNKDIVSNIASSSSNDEKFELYLQQGVNDENEGKYGDAVAAYKSAEALKQTWALYENLGRASAANGDKANAITYYKKALSMVPSSDPLSELEKNQLQENITNLGG